MKVITVISDPDNFGYILLQMACKKSNLKFIPLRYDNEIFATNRIKDSLLRNYLYKLNNDEIIFFSDGYDALLLTNQQEIQEKFAAKNVDLLFSAETYCYPDVKLESNYPETTSPYRFLNSGGFIGKVGLLKELLADNREVSETKFGHSNQYLWTLRYLQNQKQIALDNQCDIFCTFSPEIGGHPLGVYDEHSFRSYENKMQIWFEKNFMITNGRIYNSITNTWPCHVHFNGKSKCLVNDQLTNQIFGQALVSTKGRDYGRNLHVNKYGQKGDSTG
jgi:hypothetical protein